MLLAYVLVTSLAPVSAAQRTAATSACVAAGRWVAPRAPGDNLDVPQLFTALAKHKVVLLGELHDRAEHHRWQLHTIAALHARKPAMALAFEMFPRRVQSVLDRWVDGALGEAEFLAAVDWNTVWNIDANLYLPLFHFARMHRIPMIAMNVERTLIRAVVEKGYDAVPVAQREGVGKPAAAPDAYVDTLREIFREHPTGSTSGGADAARLQRFVEGQTTWDRAMAEAIAARSGSHPARQVVAILGRGHAVPGAVPHQLRDLGVSDVAVLLPWERAAACSTLVSSGAFAVFGVDEPPAAEPPPRPRLGIVIMAVADGLRIDDVNEGSIAAIAGLRKGDILVAMAGAAVTSAADVRRVVARQAPGTWLPMRVRRDSGDVELVARFPP